MTTIDYKDGRYFIRAPASLMRVPFMIAPVLVVLAAGGVLFQLAASGRGGGQGDGPPLFLMGPVMVMIVLAGTLFLSLRKMAGRGVEIDPAAGTVSFSRRTAANASATARIMIESVREIVLASRAGDWYGRPGVRHFIVRLLTGNGEEDILVLPDEANARQIAQELSGILSRQLRDMT